MPDNRLWSLIARLLSGEASVPETEELNHLLQQHPDKQQLLDILHSYFAAGQEDGADSEIPDIQLEKRFKKIVSNDFDVPQHSYDNAPVLHSKSKINRFKRFWYYAASITGIGFLSWVGYSIMQPAHGPQIAKNASKSSEVVAKPGARTKLVLPDGTQVWLNSGSRINYQSDFNSNIREVELEGEAFFDVVSSISPTTHEKIPFIVHTSSIDIKVVGTAFVVKSYPQDETVEATLLRGIIEVTRKDNPNAPKVILKPNEKLIFNKLIEIQHKHSDTDMISANLPSAVHDISVTAVPKNIPDSEKLETSWIYNRLVFNGDTFTELASKMERWYNVKINIKTEDLKRYRFKGEFTNETLRDALNALQLTVKFSYQINDNEVTIFKK